MLIMMLIATFASFALTFGLMPMVFGLAGVIGAMDEPGGRKIHVVATPRIGGLAIFLGLIFGLLILCFALRGSHVGISPLIFLLGVPMAFLIGFVDDLKGLRSSHKLLGQLALGVLVFFLGFKVSAFSIGAGYRLDLGVLSFPVTVLWVAGVMNAVNLIDGLDGLAGGLSAIALLAIGILSLMVGNVFGAGVAFVTVAAILAFLCFNFPPAQIFMGDCGSMVLGFLLAILTMSISPSGAGKVSVFVPVFLLALPFVDMFVAILRRAIRANDKQVEMNRSGFRRFVKAMVVEVLAADGDHIHHRLIARGHSTRKVVLSLYFLSAMASISAGAVFLMPTVLGWMLVSFLVVICHQLVLSLEYEEFLPPNLRRLRRQLNVEQTIESKGSLIQRVSESSR